MYDFKYTKIPNKIFEIGFGPIEIVIFCAIASHGGQSKNQIFPSHERLARMTGCSISSVKRALKKLKKHRLLNWTRDDFGKSSNYILHEIGLWISDQGSSNRPTHSGHTELPPRSNRPIPQVTQTYPPRSHRATNQTNINQTKFNQTNEPRFEDEISHNGEKIKTIVKQITSKMSRI